jgi:hypothetical protein
MPLPCINNGATRCQCKSKRTGLPCNNPAAFGQKACRMHGAHKKVAKLSGMKHPNYIHGENTQASKIERSAKSLQFLMLEKIGWHIGLFAEGSTKFRGRKPIGYPYELNNLHESDQLLKAIELSLSHSKKSNTD